MIIISGLSGAGKTVALHTLEDLGYYCIDNLPCNLLAALYEEQKNIELPVAVGIDIRSQINHIQGIPEFITDCLEKNDQTRVLFLTASTEVLIKRFSESRRKHPLTTDASAHESNLSLADAIASEAQILSPLSVSADYAIDTSSINIYELKDRIRSWLNTGNESRTTITIESFGFKNGIPIDADLMFDVRFLPNPHWEESIRLFTGKDSVIQEYLGQFEICDQFIDQTTDYLSQWLPTYLQSYRKYLTIAIGCTGGKHRSVYTAEKIAEKLSQKFGEINILHRDLPINTE